MGMVKGLFKRLSRQERYQERDPRLDQPDDYFLREYPNVEVTHRGVKAPLKTLVQIEAITRGNGDPAKGMEAIQADPSASRANRYVALLRESGVLKPHDDVTYPEPEGQ